MADIDDVMDKLDDVLDKVADNKEKIDEVLADLAEPKSVQSICWHCGGDGTKNTSGAPVSCPDCGGDGVVPGARITLTSEET